MQKGQNVAYRGKSELPVSQVTMALHFAILTITNIRPDIWVKFISGAAWGSQKKIWVTWW